MTKWVIVRRFDTAHVAHLALTILESNGVPAVVIGEHHGSIEWSPAETSGIAIKVPINCAERATRILDGFG